MCINEWRVGARVSLFSHVVPRESQLKALLSPFFSVRILRARARPRGNFSRKFYGGDDDFVFSSRGWMNNACGVALC